MGKTIAAVAGGVVLGIGAAMVIGGVLRSFLFEVSTIDPVTFSLVPLLMALVAVVAAWVPARRAARVDPIVALRAE